MQNLSHILYEKSYFKTRSNLILSQRKLTSKISLALFIVLKVYLEFYQYNKFIDSSN